MDTAKTAGLLLAALFLFGAGGAKAGGDQAVGSGVLVHRGADVAMEETGSPARRATGEQGVVVHRGEVPKRRLKAAVASNRKRFAVTAGEEIWLVDPSSGRLVACELRKTSTVGKSVVACTRGKISQVRF